MDCIILQHWMLQFGVASLGLRQIVGEIGDWMANGGPFWASYMALMSGRLIILDKCPGVRPVGVGEIWRRMLEEFVLVVTRAGPRRPAGRNSSVVAWRRGLNRGSMQCRLCGNSMPRRRTGSYHSLTCTMNLMRRTAHPCCGWCGMSGPVMRGLHPNTIITGPHW